MHQNRVLGVGRGHGACIAVVECLVIFLVERGKLLDYLCIDRVFLLGDSGRFTNKGTLHMATASPELYRTSTVLAGMANLPRASVFLRDNIACYA